MKSKFLLKSAAMAAIVLGSITFGNTVKADCNEGSIKDGKCNGTGTRCIASTDTPDCDRNS